MTLAETLLLDFDAEAASTRRVLERIPDDHADWKPHGKSMKLSTIAGHVAGLPSFGLLILTTPELNMFTQKFPKYEFTTAGAAVKYAAGAAAEVRTALSGMTDEDLLQDWSLKFDAHVIATAPRAQLYRSMFFNHLIHHRGQLNVYLRLLDVPVPGIYGPSADEPWTGEGK